MGLEDKASVEAVLDERDPSRLQIDIRVHPVAGGSFGSNTGEIQQVIREAFRDALREAQAQVDRQVLAANPPPKPKPRGFVGRVLGFAVCAGLGAVATIALSAYHPRATASVADLQSPVATPGSQSSTVPAQPQSPDSAENEPGPGTFGLHQQ
jgi:hypothetical protein